MKKIKSLAMALVVVATMLTSIPAKAQAGSTAATHGGKIVDAENYRIEMVKRYNVLVFYVLDTNYKTVSKPASGSAEFAFETGTKATSTLQADKNGALIVALPKSSFHTSCTVTINLDGKTLVGKFKNELSAAEKQHGHQH